MGRYWYDAQRPNRMTNVTLETAPGAQIALSGTRALSYTFDDAKAGAQSVNGTTVGNGNLEYTVSQDTVNGLHTLRSETYTSFNMPEKIVFGNLLTPTTSTADRTLTFVYGPEHQRMKQTVALSGTGTSSYSAGTTYYLNGIDSLGLTYEKEVKASGVTEHKHYVSAGDRVFALFVSRTGTQTTPTRSYLHQDRLRSVAAVTDETGAVVERMAYDPWGKRRNVNGTADVLDSIVGAKTDRGYTMHEHLDEMGVVHMNARVYDPLIGRFMSADSIIPNPFDLKAFNRYSYVANNPLRFVDPTGHFWEEDGAQVIREGGGSSESTYEPGQMATGDYGPGGPDSMDNTYDDRSIASRAGGWEVVYVSTDGTAASSAPPPAGSYYEYYDDYVDQQTVAACPECSVSSGAIVTTSNTTLPQADQSGVNSTGAVGGGTGVDAQVLGAGPNPASVQQQTDHLKIVYSVNTAFIDGMQDRCECSSRTYLQLNLAVSPLTGQQAGFGAGTVETYDQHTNTATFYQNFFNQPRVVQASTVFHAYTHSLPSNIQIYNGATMAQHGLDHEMRPYEVGPIALEREFQLRYGPTIDRLLIQEGIPIRGVRP